MLMNPKFLMKTAYMGMMMFGAFHFTKLSLAILGQTILSRMGKPQLVRETSKLYSNNYLTLPLVWGRK